MFPQGAGRTSTIQTPPWDGGPEVCLDSVLGVSPAPTPTYVGWGGRASHPHPPQLLSVPTLPFIGYLLVTTIEYRKAGGRQKMWAGAGGPEPIPPHKWGCLGGAWCTPRTPSVRFLVFLSQAWGGIRKEQGFSWFHGL